MKLEDIKSAVIHQTQTNLKRAIYDCAVFMSSADIQLLIAGILCDVFDDSSDDDSSDEVGKEDIPF